MTPRAERLKLMELLVGPDLAFDARKEIEGIMDEHPTATQREIYELAFRDRKFTTNVITKGRHRRHDGNHQARLTAY